MRIESDAVIKFPRALTYRTYRDDMPKFVRHLPNVRDIAVRERSEQGNVVRLVNIWQGGGDIPVAVRPLLRDSMLSWTDHATWDQDTWTCQWRIETHSFTEAVRCLGTNRFIELDDLRTRLEIRGELSIELRKVRGVPAFLAGPLGHKVEQFMVRQITTNLTTVSQGLSKYLDEQA